MNTYDVFSTILFVVVCIDIMDAMSDVNVLTNGTKEIPAKQHKSSGVCRSSRPICCIDLVLMFKMRLKFETFRYTRH